MVNYQNGKIYKIVCNDTGKQYIGSTCKKYLSQRLANHKHPSNTSSSREIIEGGNYSMVLVELCPCNSKDELHKRERHFIETMECVNQIIPSRTKKEWCEDNKEHISKRDKKYYEANKERVLEQHKEYYEANKERLMEQKKEYYEINKEKINQKKNEKHNCECGGKYTITHKSKHLKTKKHLKYLESN